MTLVDGLILVALAFAVAAGWRGGFIATTYGLVTWVVALLGAIALQAPLTELLVPLVPWPASIVRAIVFVVMVILLETIFSIGRRFAVTPVARALHRIAGLAAADRVLGVFPGVLRAAFVIAVTLAAVLVLPVGDGVRSSIEGSRLARALIAQVSVVQPLLGQLVGEGTGAPLIVTRLGADDRQTLDLPSGLALEVDPEAERQLVALVNEERAAAGLVPLELDPRLALRPADRGRDQLHARG